MIDVITNTYTCDICQETKKGDKFFMACELDIVHDDGREPHHVRIAVRMSDSDNMPCPVCIACASVMLSSAADAIDEEA